MMSLVVGFLVDVTVATGIVLHKGRSMGSYNMPRKEDLC
jgi:hypothetical protein